MDYPQEFSGQARARVEAARLRALQDLAERGKQSQPLTPRSFGLGGLIWTNAEEDLHHYILGVFLAFAREACDLGRQGMWAVDRIRSEADEFLRKFTIEAYHERGHDGSGHQFREVVSHWNGGLLQEVERKFHQSAEWRQFEAELLAVAERQSANNAQRDDLTESVTGGGVPPANAAGPTEPTGDESLKEAGTHGTNGKGADRRAEIDTFLRKCNLATSLKANRKHIWRAAGHRTARQFQFWQASDPKATAQDDQNFRRILAMSPTDFIALLKKKSII